MNDNNKLKAVLDDAVEEANNTEEISSEEKEVQKNK